MRHISRTSPKPPQSQLKKILVLLSLYGMSEYKYAFYHIVSLKATRGYERKIIIYIKKSRRSRKFIIYFSRSFRKLLGNFNFLNGFFLQGWEFALWFFEQIALFKMSQRANSQPCVFVEIWICAMISYLCRTTQSEPPTHWMPKGRSLSPTLYMWFSQL